jgi:hypothetical protein
VDVHTLGERAAVGRMPISFSTDPSGSCLFAVPCCIPRQRLRLSPDRDPKHLAVVGELPEGGPLPAVDGPDRGPADVGED